MQVIDDDSMTFYFAMRLINGKIKGLYAIAPVDNQCDEW